MFTLKKTRLPATIKVNGSRFRIQTDYRYFLRFQEHIKDTAENATAYDYMYVNEKPADRIKGLEALVEFMQPKSELPRRTGHESKEVVIDYELDAPYIYAAFYECYGIDLLQKPLHWYCFLALLHGLHDTELNNIINARLWKPNGRNGEYEKARQKQYEAWRLPQPDDGHDEELDEFLSQFIKKE